MAGCEAEQSSQEGNKVSSSFKAQYDSLLQCYPPQVRILKGNKLQVLTAPQLTCRPCPLPNPQHTAADLESTA